MRIVLIRVVAVAVCLLMEISLCVHRASCLRWLQLFSNDREIIIIYQNEGIVAS